MNFRPFRCLILVVALLLAAACADSQQSDGTPTEPAQYSGRLDSYVATAPDTLRSGQTHNISVSLFRGAEPARGTVQVELLETGGGRKVAEVTEVVPGNASVPLAVPPLDEGAYTLRISGKGDDGGDFEHTADVQVRADEAVLFLETDKPIYKPGQQVHIRVLRLDQDLRPLPGQVTVEVLDAKGIKVYRQTAEADRFGMAGASLPLSSEPNLGVWKLVAKSGDQATQLDVRVEEYVLPKYEVTVDLAKEWVLPNEAVSGTVSAEYSFGKPVRGEVEVVASRYVGVWEEYARFTANIDGEASFELPPVEYVAGSPSAGGQGNLQLDVTVREPATGYVEQTSELLIVSASPVNLQLIPESSHFKPGLPFTLLLVSETPDHQPVDSSAAITVAYYDRNLELISEESSDTETSDGKTLIELAPPGNAVAVTVVAQTDGAERSLTLEASYSPSSNFIHVEQVGDTLLEVGDQAAFRVHSTSEARTFYHEVVASGRVVFSSSSHTPDIVLGLTPQMAPSARLVVYQVLPNNEVAADHIPFEVSSSYPMQVEVGFSVDQAGAGEAVDILVNTEGPARVGLAAVDRSVFILAENRLNLQQVFAELERLYAEPQVEVHLEYLPHKVTSPGASETFREAGLMVMSDKPVPEGAAFSRPLPQPSFEERAEAAMPIALAVLMVLAIVGSIAGIFAGARYGFGDIAWALFGGLMIVTLAVVAVWVGRGSSQEDWGPAAEVMAVAAPVSKSAMSAADASGGAGTLAEVQRVRQFFPETWLWTDVITDETGSATVPVTTPDSITTWKLRAVGMSPEHGLGVADAELTVFQPFFIQVDLPYSAIRGEEFPVQVALYNYLDTAQEFFVELDGSPSFTMLGEGATTVTVEPNEVGGVDFDVRLTELGSVPFKVTARSQESADAVIETMLVEPEGVGHEIVENAILSAEQRLELDIAPPDDAIPGSDRTYVNLTGSYVAQALDGLEDLLQMPYGCGEQNMILFAPNIYVARYLEATGQSKPEVMAKAEYLMTTGYQRELTYQRDDGSFSAFGQSDDEGSLWLTAFVLKSFAQADGIIYIDEGVMERTLDWVRRHQRADGSFEPVGFVHNRGLLGGLHGNTALTAYVAVALLEAGDRDASGHALSFLESQVGEITDPYAMAIAAYALALGDSSRASEAHERLMDMASGDEDGLHWGDVAGVETTGYAVLALLERGDVFNASRGVRWLIGQRNAHGGFGSTQDTVIGLQALIGSATQAKFDVDMTVKLTAGDWSRRVTVDESNADVVQIVELPPGARLEVAAIGSGEVIAQVVHRFNMPEVERPEVEMFQVAVDYSADHVSVDDFIDISARLTFTPPASMEVEAGMIVLDVAVPTGFAPVTRSVEALVEDMWQVKRFEVAGRKVILYIEDLRRGESVDLEFQARAQYPVRAQPVTSQAYSYYNPHWRGETLGSSVVVEDS